MLSILIILAFGVLYMHDELPAPLLQVGLTPWSVVIAAWAPMLTLLGSLWLAVLALERKLDRTGRTRFAALGERLVAISRPAVAAVHVSSVLVLGLPRAMRAIVGDMIFVDELLCLIPLVVGLMGGWWIIYPIERRMREAMILRHLDAGRPVFPLPGRWKYAWASFRMQVLFVFLPLAGMLAWTELSLRVIGDLPRAWRAEWREPALVTGAHVLGIAGMLLAMPLALRYVWDTVAMGDSPLTRRLLALCGHYRVRVRRLLMWRTDGVIVNGAVVGVLPPMRYILLTDALLEQLPTAQIEAVMAHEVAHVRCRHMLWLGLCVLATVFGVSVVAELALGLFPGLDPGGATASLAVLGVTMVGIFWTFGVASRVFERQADAFAARHMSGELGGEPEAGGIPGGGVFSAPGVAAMSDALENVALLNGIAPGRFTWRHGSIAQRVEHLRQLGGHPLGRVPVDRTARRVKWLSALGMAASVLVMLLSQGVR